MLYDFSSPIVELYLDAALTKKIGEFDLSADEPQAVYTDAKPVARTTRLVPAPAAGAGATTAASAPVVKEPAGATATATPVKVANPMEQRLVRIESAHPEVFKPIVFYALRGVPMLGMTASENNPYIELPESHQTWSRWDGELIASRKNFFALLRMQREIDRWTDPARLKHLVDNPERGPRSDHSVRELTSMLSDAFSDEGFREYMYEGDRPELREIARFRDNRKSSFNWTQFERRRILLRIIDEVLPKLRDFAAKADQTREFWVRGGASYSPYDFEMEGFYIRLGVFTSMHCDAERIKLLPVFQDSKKRVDDTRNSPAGLPLKMSPSDAEEFMQRRPQLSALYRVSLDWVELSNELKLQQRMLSDAVEIYDGTSLEQQFAIFSVER